MTLATFCYDCQDDEQKSKVMFIFKTAREGVLIDNGGMSRFQVGKSFAWPISNYEDVHTFFTIKSMRDCKTCKHGLRLFAGKCRPELRFEKYD